MFMVNVQTYPKLYDEYRLRGGLVNIIEGVVEAISPP
jgi:hypothetical protein